MAVLYRLERMQPFTRLHAKPLLGALPLLLVTLAGRTVFPTRLGPLLGTGLGLGAYAATLHWLGFTRLEGRLVASLLGRYRGTVRALGRSGRG